MPLNLGLSPGLDLGFACLTPRLLSLRTHPAVPPLPLLCRFLILMGPTLVEHVLVCSRHKVDGWMYHPSTLCLQHQNEFVRL